MDVTIQNEYGVEIERRVIFPWERLSFVQGVCAVYEPVMFLQTRLSNMLCYPVKLYSQGVEKHPCDPWMNDDTVIVCKEVFPTSIWNQVLELRDDRFQSMDCKIVNTTNGIEVYTDIMNDLIDNKLQFQVKSYPSDDMPWIVSIPVDRLDIIDTITGDLSVTKAELLYINIVMESFDEDIIKLDEDRLPFSKTHAFDELLEYLCIVVRVYDTEGECRYVNYT